MRVAVERVVGEEMLTAASRGRCVGLFRCPEREQKGRLSFRKLSSVLTRVVHFIPVTSLWFLFGSEVADLNKETHACSDSRSVVLLLSSWNN
ncbi:hypothetical protein GN956_G14033 [Arapaima gigas]